MLDVDNRRGAPVRLQLDLLDAADDGELVGPGAGGIDHNGRLEAFLPGAELPAGAEALRRMDPGAGDDVHPAGLGTVPVVGQEQRGVAAEGAGVQAGGGEGIRHQHRAEPQCLGVGDALHVAAGLGTDGGVVPDQHEAARREHRFGAVGVPGGDEFQGPEGELLDHGGAVTGDQLPRRARGGVIGQGLLGLDQGHTAFPGEGGGKGQAGDTAADNHDIVMG